MRGIVVVLLLAGGCNQTFGLEPTVPVDAAYFDGLIDAPFACPPFGTTPVFSKVLHQVVVQPVFEYTVSAATMRAMGDSSYGIMEGPVDGVMAPAPGFPQTGQCGACTHIVGPRLTPEGNGAYVRVETMLGSHVSFYRPVGGTWTLVTDLPISSALFISSVSRGPTRRLLTDDIDGLLHEYSVDDSGASSEILPPYSLQELGLTSAQSPMLTADGLRMVFLGITAGSSAFGTFYADRSAIGGRFSAARPLVDVPGARGAFLTEDCARIYLSGLGSVFYAQRE